MNGWGLLEFYSLHMRRLSYILRLSGRPVSGDGEDPPVPKGSG
jgi:hypothetical protein